MGGEAGELGGTLIFSVGHLRFFLLALMFLISNSLFSHLAKHYWSNLFWPQSFSNGQCSSSVMARNILIPSVSVTHNIHSVHGYLIMEQALAFKHFAHLSYVQCTKTPGPSPGVYSPTG